MRGVVLDPLTNKPTEFQLIRAILRRVSNVNM